MMRRALLRLALIVCVTAPLAGLDAAAPEPPAILGGRSLLHAHNAYPEDGRWRDRIDRALATGVPVVIEQDVAFAPRNEPLLRTVVSHEAKLHGSEPSLQEYFFDRVRPIIERELASRRSDRWPAIVLHLDFKSNERDHHRAVWDLLRRHQSWLTTAAAGGDSMTISPIKRGPLLVLTENGANQEKDFLEWSAAEGSLLVFGSIPPPAVRQSDDPAERARILHQAAPHELIPTAATSYRRWVNFPWTVVEVGGPPEAREWTRDDQQRLASVVDYAHQQGLLVRFYTLNGHAADASRGWTASYNFGSLDAVRARWRAAIDAHVDLIATDQYEEFVALLKAKP